jgi:hypothetical protein
VFGVSVALAQERGPGFTVKGRIVQPASNASLSPYVVMSRSGGDVSQPGRPMQSTIQPDGTFEFKDVPAGQYALRVFGGSHGTPLTVPGFRTLTVTVQDRDVTVADVVIPAFFELRGHVLVDGGPRLPPDLSRLQVQAQLGSASRFSRPGGDVALVLPTGSYEISVPGVPMNYSVESISYGNSDLRSARLPVDAPMTSQLEVRLATFPPKGGKAATVRGTVTNLPPASFRQQPRVRLTREARAGGGAVEAAVGDDGNFEFKNVPSGVYAVSTQGLSASFASTLTVAGNDVPDMIIALAGISNPFPEFVEAPGRAFSPVFDSSRVITLRGVLTQEITPIRPPAPLMYFRIDVADPATGTIENWAVLLSKSGVRSPADIPGIDRLKVGTRITVTGDMSRDGSNRVSLVPIPAANTAVGLNVN